MEQMERKYFDRLFTAKELAERLRVPRKKVYELGIPAIKIGKRALRYRESDVHDWIEGRRRVP